MRTRLLNNWQKNLASSKKGRAHEISLWHFTATWPPRLAGTTLRRHRLAVVQIVVLVSKKGERGVLSNVPGNYNRLAAPVCREKGLCYLRGRESYQRVSYPSFKLRWTPA